MPNWNDPNLRGPAPRAPKKRKAAVAGDQGPMRDSYCGKRMDALAPDDDKCQCSIWLKGSKPPLQLNATDL